MRKSVLLLGLVIMAATVIPSWAGESPYTGPGSSYQPVQPSTAGAIPPHTSQQAQAAPANTLHGNAIQYTNVSPAQATIVPNVSQPTNMMSYVAPTPMQAREVLAVTYQAVGNKGDYQGFRYIFRNNRPEHLQVISAQVLNGVDEATVANQNAQRSYQRRSVAGGLLRGLANIPFASGLGYASNGAYQAASVGSSVANTAANAISYGNDPNSVVTGGYVSHVDSIYIDPQGMYTFNTLVPRGVQPQIKLVFKSLETNQIFDYQQ